MATSLSSVEHVARKLHIDNGSQYFDWCITRDQDKRIIVDMKEVKHLNMTINEIVSIQRSIDNGWRILPGEKYIRQTAVDDGNFWVYKTRSDIHEICCKYSLYQED